MDFPLTNRLEGSLQLCSVNEWPGTCFLSVLLVFLSASLRTSQLYWPSGQLCFGGSVHSTHPSRYKSFLVPAGPCACFLLAHPLLHSPNWSSHGYFIFSARDLLFCFCFISDLILLSSWDILDRTARMRLYFICPAYCRQVFNTAELVLSYTPQNVRLLFKPVTCWGPWSAHGM